MRKGLLALLTISLLLSLAPQTIGKVIAGGSCKKEGRVLIRTDYQLTCVKKGKKLIWKSSPIKISAPQPSPTPSTTLSTTPSTTGPKRPGSFAELDAGSSWIFVYEELQSVLRKNPEVAIAQLYEYIYGETVARDSVNVIHSANALTWRFFSDIYTPDNPIVEFYGTELDEAAWRNILLRLNGNLDQWFYVTNAQRDNYLYFGAAGKDSALYMLGSKSRPSAAGLKFLAVHETSHIFQNAMTPNGNATRISHDSQGNVVAAEINLPILFLEGHADLIAFNVAYEDKEASRQEFTRRARESSSGYGGRAAKDPQMDTVEQVVEYFLKWEDPNYIYKKLPNGEFPSASAIYHTGNIALTGLTAVKGYEPMKEFFKKVKSGIPYQKAFQESYGMSLTDFYREVAPYVISVRKYLGLSSE